MNINLSPIKMDKSKLKQICILIMEKNPAYSKIALQTINAINNNSPITKTRMLKIINDTLEHYKSKLSLDEIEMLVNAKNENEKSEMKMQTKLFYSVKEVSEILNISEFTIRKYLEVGKIAGIRFSKKGRWRIPVVEIENKTLFNNLKRR